jgi:hypothetical protein
MNSLIEAILFIMAVASANGNVIPGIVARSLIDVVRIHRVIFFLFRQVPGARSTMLTCRPPSFVVTSFSQRVLLRFGQSLSISGQSSIMLLQE